MSLFSSPRALFVFASLWTCSSCNLGTQQSAGIRMVDNLVSQVETVQIESELTRQVVFEALRGLHPLVADGYQGDVTESYLAFAQGVERSEAQTVRFAKALDPMRSAAGRVFERWEANLDQFQGKAMRQRSQQRLDAARERYGAVLSSAERAQADLLSFNLGMRDLVLFLGIDLNRSSIAAIEEEARGLATSGQALRKTFEECSQAAERYVLEAAPLGQLQAELQTAVEPTE